MRRALSALPLLLLAGAGAVLAVSPAEQVTINAAQQQWVQDQLWCAQGDVHLQYQDISLRCDAVEVDLKTMHLHAEGNVILDQGQTRMTCTRVEFDLQKKVGTLYDVEAFLPPTYHFRGQEMEKIDETHYRFRKGLFTSCELSDKGPPAWSIQVSDALVELEGYGHFRNAELRAGKVPVFYAPRLLWPVKRDRATGLLVPNFGYSSQRGTYLGNSFFWPISRSFDATFSLDLWSKGYIGLGTEFRWAPAENALGGTIPYLVWDPIGKRWEWKATGKHNQLFAGGYTLHAELDEVSNRGFFQQFESSIDLNAQPTLYSYVSLSRSWGPQTINYRVDHRQAFSFDIYGQTTEATFDRLGEVEYRLRSTRIGNSPFYASGVTSADEFYVNRTATLSGRYGRFDVNPAITLLTPGFPWLSITPTVGFRETYYTLQNSQDGLSLVNEPLSRHYASAVISLVGPSFSRVWNQADDEKIKHLIEPRVDYTYVSNPGDIFSVPVFDEKDSVLVTNKLTWAFANRMFIKTAKGSREVASLEVSQDYSLSEPLTPARFVLDPASQQTFSLPANLRGPLSLWLRAAPFMGSTVDARAYFDPVTRKLQSTSLSGGVIRGASSLNLTWYSSADPITGATSSSQTRVSLALAPGGAPWRIESQTAYDIFNAKLLEERLQFRWRGSCWAAIIELHDYRIPPYPNRSYRIAIDLTGLGTFLDVHGSLSPMSP
jgi:LPS-assembly protein